jgi:hypothetical protein
MTIKTASKRKKQNTKRRDSTIASSIALHEARSNASHPNSRRHNGHGSRVEKLKHSNR